ncbi:MAG: hypothetical protein HWD92_06295 [Flavobacteriia bacterium]|nr:hypothetical protein [Flavobacteriia bacterium]
MKRILLLSLITIGLSFSVEGPFQQPEWDDATREVFMSNCVTNAESGMGTEMAEDYCSCVLVKVEKEFPNPEDAINMTVEQVTEWAMQCLEGESENEGGKK